MAQSVDLIKKGINHLVAGEIAPILTYLARRFVIGSGEIETIEPPAWVSSEKSECMVNKLASPANLYRSVLQSVEDSHKFDFSETVDGIEFEIITPALDSETEVFVQIEGSEQSVKVDIDNYQPSSVPISIDFDHPTHQCTLRMVRNPKEGLIAKGNASANHLLRRHSSSVTSLPHPRAIKRMPPIFLLSIDTLRFDQYESMQPLLEALGPNAQVPAEPRTQGNWTPAAHASMFTGTHPGTHLYLGWGPQGQNHVIRPDIVTIPEFLCDHLYKCSGTAAHTRILPEFGFGRCMHRFEINNMRTDDWITRDRDARGQVETLMKWIDADLSRGSDRVFYFGHFFDPHFPYLPPPPITGADLNIGHIKQFLDDTKGGYLDRYAARYDPLKPQYDHIKSLYSRSVNHTATQVARLIEHIKKVGLFDEALIIVTGDHGEEFGERGFYTHNSLYDTNIRPFIAIKPPDSVDWPTSIRTIDHIDFLPTIAEVIDATPPDTVQGIPVQNQNRSDRPRITERIRPDSYNISIEIDGTKAILTYRSNYPYRPGAADVENGPILSEFYDISKVRDGDFTDIGDSLNIRDVDEFYFVAEEFIRQDTDTIAHYTDLDITRETDAFLEDLGYK